MTRNNTTANLDSQNVETPDATRDAAEIVAIAWPTYRAVYPYTADELAEGVDVYTRAMKAAEARDAQ